jgi:hypothetical protein
MLGRSGAGAGGRAAPGMSRVMLVSGQVYGRIISAVINLVSGVAASRNC